MRLFRTDPVVAAILVCILLLAGPYVAAAEMRGNTLDQRGSDGRHWGSNRKHDRSDWQGNRDANGYQQRRPFGTVPDQRRNPYRLEDRDRRYGRDSVGDGYRRGYADRGNDGYGRDRGYGGGYGYGYGRRDDDDQGHGFDGGYDDYGHGSGYGDDGKPQGWRGDGTTPGVRRDYPGVPEGMRRYPR